MTECDRSSARLERHRNKAARSLCNSRHKVEVGGSIPSGRTEEVVHYFEEMDHISARGAGVTFSVEVRILCDATSGEADNRKSKVTCPECRALLRRE